MTANNNTSGKSRQVSIGNTVLGGNNPVRIQSMTKTGTTDVRATADQCKKAFDAGADYMRISIPDTVSLHAFEKIRSILAVSGYGQPMIADIHYRQDLAIWAASLADKLRINPCNFGLYHPRAGSPKGLSHPIPKKTEAQQEWLRGSLAPIAEACQTYGTAIRLGGNAGSLVRDPDNTTPVSMQLVNLNMQYIEALESLGFHDTVVSVKMSDPEDTTRACRLMHTKMQQMQKNYPLHIGVTEAGMGISGRVGSALGILPLLQEGLGDTIRVSLTEPPEQEIHFAKALLNAHQGESSSFCKTTLRGGAMEISCDAGHIDMLIALAVQAFLNVPHRQEVKNINIHAPGIKHKHLAGEVATEILQLAGIRSSATRFVSCPACARAGADMENLCRLFRNRLGAFPGVTIAVMGCMVNGPGEMGAADYGIIASSEGRVSVYEGDRCIKRNIAPEEAISLIRDQLKKDRP